MTLAVGVGVMVRVGVGVRLGVGEGVLLGVGVTVALGVGVRLGVLVSVGVGVAKSKANEPIQVPQRSNGAAAYSPMTQNVPETGSRPIPL